MADGTTSVSFAARSAATESPPSLELDHINAETETADRLMFKLYMLGCSEPRVSIGSILTAAGRQSLGAGLLILGLMGVSPLAAIPGLPSLLALTTLGLSIPLLLGLRTPWLPRFISRREVEGEALVTAAEKMAPMARRLDLVFRERLVRLHGGLGRRLCGLFCIILALMVPPLEFLPFVAAAPMAGIAAFGLSLVVRDGLVVLFAGIVMAAFVSGLALHLI